MGFLILIAAFGWFGAVASDTAQECHPRMARVIHDCDRRTDVQLARERHAVDHRPQEAVPSHTEPLQPYRSLADLGMPRYMRHAMGPADPSSVPPPPGSATSAAAQRDSARMVLMPYADGRKP